MRRGVMSQSDRIWPLAAVLILVVVVPTAGMLWLLAESVDSQSYVVRERLRAAYGRDLRDLGRRMDAFWRDKTAEAVEVAGSLMPGERSSVTPAEAFRVLTASTGWDGAVVYDASGEVLYPSIDTEPPEIPGGEDSSIAPAERMEGRGEWNEAAQVYDQVIDKATRPDIEAQAWLGRARCLARIGNPTAAVEILVEKFSGTALELPHFFHTTDSSGRAITPTALLLALELIQKERVHTDTLGIDASQVAHFVEGILNAYGGPNLPSSERLFLMRRLLDTGLGPFEFPTMEVEELSLSWLESAESPPEEEGRLVRSGDLFVSLIPFRGGRLLGLVTPEHLRSWIDEAVGRFSFPEGVSVALVFSSSEVTEAFVVSDLLETADGSLALFVNDPDFFGEAESRRVMILLWSGALVLGAVVILVIAAVRLMMHRMRTARLKNDLIATVSHELKTPLSSMRVLVDTLREGNYRDQQQVREYLELISKENLRLSRLIDNFLAFSRMERNKHAFEFEEVSMREIVDEALEVMSERLKAPGCRVEVDVARDLPDVRADHSALVTVLTNLLDNAWKYTEDEKRITVRAFTEDRNVCLSVRDNGIGMTGRETRRIFERFYQSDQHLSRRASGCGLGLAIVRFIIDAHGGDITVKSEPGKGSTFTVRLPAGMENGVREA